MDRQEFVTKARGAAAAGLDVTIGWLYLGLALQAGGAAHAGYDAVEGFFAGEGAGGVASDVVRLGGAAGSLVMTVVTLKGAGTIRQRFDPPPPKMATPPGLG